MGFWVWVLNWPIMQSRPFRNWKHLAPHEMKHTTKTQDCSATWILYQTTMGQRSSSKTPAAGPISSQAYRNLKEEPIMEITTLSQRFWDVLLSICFFFFSILWGTYTLLQHFWDCSCIKWKWFSVFIHSFLDSKATLLQIHNKLSNVEFDRCFSHFANFQHF